MLSKKNKKIVKIMFKNSLTNGNVDEKKVTSTLKEISSKKPKALISILKNYKKLIELKITKEEIIIESASKVEKLSKIEKELLKKTGALKVKYKVNPKIVFGSRITYGDWIYDATLLGKLDKLTNQQ